MKKHSAKFNKTMWIKTIVVAVVLISVELIAGFSLYHNFHISLWTLFLGLITYCFTVEVRLDF